MATLHGHVHSSMWQLHMYVNTSCALGNTLAYISDVHSLGSCGLLIVSCVCMYFFLFSGIEPMAHSTRLYFFLSADCNTTPTYCYCLWCVSECLLSCVRSYRVVCTHSLHLYIMWCDNVWETPHHVWPGLGSNATSTADPRQGHSWNLAVDSRQGKTREIGTQGALKCPLCANLLLL